MAVKPTHGARKRGLLRLTHLARAAFRAIAWRSRGDNRAALASTTLPRRLVHRKGQRVLDLVGGDLADPVGHLIHVGWTRRRLALPGHMLQCPLTCRI
jgi:hypothetical protein